MIDPKSPIYNLPSFLFPADSILPQSRADMFKCLVDPKGSLAEHTYVRLSDLFAWLSTNGYPALESDCGLAGATTAEPLLNKATADDIAKALHGRGPLLLNKKDAATIAANSLSFSHSVRAHQESILKTIPPIPEDLT